MLRSTSPTQLDVARATGLSQATVSRALRGDTAVIKETRDLVMRTCMEMGYRPSISARVLAEGRDAVVGVSLSSDSRPTDRYVSVLHQALTRQLVTSGWAATLLEQTHFGAQLSEIGGTILIGVTEDDPRLAACRDAEVPVVAIGYCGDPNVSSVVPDDSGGGAMAIEHLVQSGCRTIGMLSSRGVSGNPAMNLRRKAAIDAAEQAGVQLCIIEALPDVTNTLSGYRSATRMSDQFADLDGLFCDTDEHALGVRSAFEDLAQTPNGSRFEIAIVGFDDLPGLSADLTTIRQDFDSIAQTAIALWRAARDEDAAEQVTLPVELIVR